MAISEAALLRAVLRDGSLASACTRLGVSREEAEASLEALAGRLEREAQPSEPKAPPPAAAPGRWQLYSDGAARGNPGPAGAGAVLVSPSGGRERLGRFLGAQTNNVAEYEGLLLGLRRAQELGIRELDILADSELMVRQLSGAYRVKAPGLLPLFEQARALLRGFQKVDVRHVRREENREADEMSNRAIDERM